MKFYVKIILILLVCNSPLYSQSEYHSRAISKETKKIVKKLKHFNLVTSKRIGRSALIPDQYFLFMDLEKTASEIELYELTNHKNSLIRAFSFLGLIEKDSKLLIDVLRKNEFDTTEIRTQNGCLLGTNTVIGYMFNQYRDYIEKNDIKLSETNKELYDRIYENYMNYKERKWNRLNKNKRHITSG
jgi:hypothetical protein